MERLKELSRSDSELGADDIRERTLRVPSTAHACGSEIVERKMATVSGCIRSTTLPPRQSVPVLVAELYDGDRSINLVWVGRRTIAGIEPGAFLTASGRVAKVKGQLAIFNPAYQLAPTP